MRRWSALKFLAGLALELVSCVQSRMPISAEQREAMRAFEQALIGECSEKAKADRHVTHPNQDLARPALPQPSCALFLE